MQMTVYNSWGFIGCIPANLETLLVTIDCSMISSREQIPCQDYFCNSLEEINSLILIDSQAKSSHVKYCQI